MTYPVGTGWSMTSSRSMTGSTDQEDIVTRRYRLEYDQQPEYDRFDRSGCYVSIVPSLERSELSTMLDMAVVLSTMLDMAVAGLSIVLDTAVSFMYDIIMLFLLSLSTHSLRSCVGKGKAVADGP